MITLDDARRVIAAAEQKAKEIGQPMNIAVVDQGGNLVAHVRMDNAWMGSVDISINKAWTARAFDISTKQLAELSQSGGSVFRNTRLESWPCDDFRWRHSAEAWKCGGGGNRRKRRHGKTRSGCGGIRRGSFLTRYVTRALIFGERFENCARIVALDFVVAGSQKLRPFVESGSKGGGGEPNFPVALGA